MDKKEFNQLIFETVNKCAKELKHKDDIDIIEYDLTDEDFAEENIDTIKKYHDGKINNKQFLTFVFPDLLDEDEMTDKELKKNTNINESQLAFDHQLDNISRNDSELRKNLLITKEMIDDLVTNIKKFDFLFKDKSTGQYTLDKVDENTLLSRVPAIYEVVVDGDYEHPSKCFKAKASNTFGIELVNHETGEQEQMILSPYDAVAYFVECKGIKYRTAQLIENQLREEYPNCFRDHHQNYINPAEISDPASREILAMDIPVTNHDELLDNFMELTGGEATKCDEFEGVAYLWDEPVSSHPGHYRHHDKEITTYLCLTEESLNKKSIITPDCLVLCEDCEDGSSVAGIFNLKTGYNKNEKAWKNDYMSITRKIKQQLKDKEMTDFKQQDTARHYSKK